MAQGPVVQWLPDGRIRSEARWRRRWWRRVERTLRFTQRGKDPVGRKEGELKTGRSGPSGTAASSLLLQLLSEAEGLSSDAGTGEGQLFDNPLRRGSRRGG